MVNINYNGKTYALDRHSTIGDLLKKEGKSDIPMMVSLNNNTLQREELDNIILKNGDYLNVILFLGGG